MPEEGMVHALQEAWRVLKPNSYLIDLRPAARHARIGLVCENDFTIQWKMRESLESYRSANRVLRIVEDMRLFKCENTRRFSCTIVFSTIQYLKDWLYDWYETEALDLADELVGSVEDAIVHPELYGEITARIPFLLKALVKQDSPM
jgi:hypothetical protein